MGLLVVPRWLERYWIYFVLPQGCSEIITCHGCTPHEIHYAQQIFPYNLTRFEDGLKYLGFFLKPMNYKIVDWNWLITKIEKRLNNWCHRWLSRSGRLTLIKLVLEATPIYWMSLAWIPKGILLKIQKICRHFLWLGAKKGHTFAWTNWSRIALPKRWGGWGIKDLPTFALALSAKLGWTILTGNNLWTRVTIQKYIHPLTPIEWIRSPLEHHTKSSTI